MKCLNKKAFKNKQALEAERERIAEEARWNSLTPEEQEKELAEKAERREKVLETLNGIEQIMNHIELHYKF